MYSADKFVETGHFATAHVLAAEEIFKSLEPMTKRLSCVYDLFVKFHMNSTASAYVNMHIGLLANGMELLWIKVLGLNSDQEIDKLDWKYAHYRLWIYFDWSFNFAGFETMGEMTWDLINAQARAEERV